MLEEIEKVIGTYQKALNKRKARLQNDSNELQVTDETKMVNVHEMEVLEDSEGSEDSENSGRKEESEVVDEQLEMLDDMLQSLPMSQLYIRDAEIYSDSNLRFYNEIQKFQNNLLLTSHNKIAHVAISNYNPNPDDLWDYIRDNHALKTFSIDTKFFYSEDFINDQEFISALNSAPNLFYIQVSIAKEASGGVSSKLLEEDFTEEKMFIIACDNRWYLKRPNCNEITYVYMPEYDDDGFHKISEEDFISQIAVKETFNLELVLSGIISKVVSSAKEESHTSCIDNVSVDGEQMFDGWYLIDYAAMHDDTLTAQFLITLGVKPSLHAENGEEQTSLAIAAKYASSNMLRILLEISLPLPLSDKHLELNQEKRTLLEKVDVEKNTPLLIAVKARKLENVKFLLKCGSNVLHKNVMGQTAFEIAINNDDCACALILLQSGSLFHKDFNINNISEDSEGKRDLEGFVQLCEQYTNFIKGGCVEDVKRAIDISSLTPIFRSLRNESAVSVAFLSDKYEVYALLKSRGFRLFDDEPQLDAFSLSSDQKDKIEHAMIKYINKPKFSTITYLLSRSRALQTEPRRYEFIRQLYEALTDIPEVQIILETLECAPLVLDIIFDFESDNIQDISPRSSSNTAGACDYVKGRIFFGAKVDYCELLGTMAHEFTHQAMQIIFENKCFPYKENNMVMINAVNEIISDINKKKASVDEIISRVFKNYDEPDWPAEIIVRVPHILAKYGAARGSALLSGVAKLLSLYKTEVVDSCREFIINARLDNRKVSPESFVLNQDKNHQATSTLLFRKMEREHAKLESDEEFSNKRLKEKNVLKM